MVRKATNKGFRAAKAGKNDEFYTRLPDIERELKNYKKHFKGKVVLCNCDDPWVSNFFVYFSQNFKRLGLKKLITTCYKNSQPNMFSEHNSSKAVWLEYTGVKNGDRVPTPEEIGVKKLDGDGDFRSQECIELLKQSDIVVTNPPFSLFREYVGQLASYDKKFLAIGTWNAITYKEIFKLIKENKLWIGINSNRNFSGFIVPKHYPLHGTEARVDENGDRIVSSNNTCWFTNMDIAKRHEDLVPYKTYNLDDYPSYDNYDAIEVAKTNEIPADYEGLMAVPITFLQKYNPAQFEILGIMDRANSSGLRTKVYDKAEVANANDLNARGVIRINGVYKSMYARLLIKWKK
jgi:hypothetical protein